MVITNDTFSTLTDSAHECAIVSTILLDELDRTDKIINLNNFCKTIGRGVSFVKKSLSRNNSNLSASSLHKSSCHSTSSNHSSFTSLSGSGSEDSGEPLTHCELRSCLKGSRMINDSRHRKRGSRKYVVRFHKRTKEYKIEPFFEYATDLWYTTSKEKETFLSPQLCTVAETIQAEQYMLAFTRTKRQVYPKEWFDMKEPKARSSSYTKMLVKAYQDIVQGRKYGFAGLEQYSACLKKRRKTHIQSMVLMVCAAYYDCKRNDIASIVGNSKIQAKANPDGTLSSKVIVELVRKYSKSLSEADRYWATAMRQADYDAAVEVYNENCGKIPQQLSQLSQHQFNRSVNSMDSRNTISDDDDAIDANDDDDQDDYDDDDVEEFY